MSQLSKSLEKRIQELTASIEAQQTELAAYERVLDMEVSSEGKPSESSEETEAPLEEKRPRKGIKKRAYKKASKKATKKTVGRKAKAGAAPADLSAVPFTGSKTSMVVAVVKSYGREGVTPKEVDAFFAERGVPRSKNLIYNTLSYLVAHDKLVRREGKYYLPNGRSTGAKKKKAPAKKKAMSKRRLSPEGLKRIKEALKKRWAAKKAAPADAGEKT